MAAGCRSSSRWSGRTSPDIHGRVALDVADVKAEGVVRLVGYCPTDADDEIFPHLHGSVPLTAVRSVRPLVDALAGAASLRERTVPRVSGAPVSAFIEAVAMDPEVAREQLRADPRLLHGSWAEDEDGSWVTPMHYFAREDARPDCVRLLVGAGADVDALSDLKYTPLLVAAMEGHAEVAAVLLELGADPDAAAFAVDSALHCAARAGDRRLMEALLDGGANPRVVGDENETIFDVLPWELERRSALLDLFRERRITRPTL